MTSTQAIILSVGDELVLGQTVDTNSAWLAARLARLGIPVLAHETVPDDRDAIADAVTRAAERADVVLVTGGLGPTDDDLTRQALASAMAQPLELHEPSLRRIEAFFRSRGRSMPDRNKVQAMHPRGSTMIDNPNGTAPGLRAELGRAVVYVTPGVPREMQAMYEASIEPELRQRNGGRHVILTTTIHTFGAGESDVAQKLDELMDRGRNPKVGTTVSNGFVSVRIRSEFATVEEAQRRLNQTCLDVELRLGPLVFGRDNDTLQGSLIRLMERDGHRLVTAESCTGGLVGAMLTDVPGASRVYLGGWVTYSNAMKHQQLGVPRPMLDQHGAVSEPVARAMAEGALRHSHGANLSIALTGIAGPDGGTPEKPVGTVWIALGRRDDRQSKDITTEPARFRLVGDRDAIRDRSAKCALQWLRLYLLGEPLAHLTWAATK